MKETIIKYTGNNNMPITLIIKSEINFTEQEINSLKHTLSSKYFIPFENDLGITAFDFKIIHTNLWAEKINIMPTFGNNDSILSLKIELNIFRDLKTNPADNMSDYSLMIARSIIE